MEVTVIPEAEQIEFEGFAFYQLFIRYISNINRSEVRLSCYRTQSRKLRTVKFYKIIIDQDACIAKDSSTSGA
jgi:hypothetical protein